MNRLTEIATAIQREACSKAPSELAKLADQLSGGEMGQFFLINVFTEAFPQIPLRQMIRASRWHYVCEGGVSDVEFDEILKPWFLGNFEALNPPPFDGLT